MPKKTYDEYRQEIDEHRAIGRRAGQYEERQQVLGDIELLRREEGCPQDVSAEQAYEAALRHCEQRIRGRE